MLKHTPGPWEVDGNTELPLAVIKGDGSGYGIAEIAPQDGDGEARSNARLIAAAPTLLEAAKAAVAVWDGWGTMQESMEALREAIRKAEAGN